MFAWLRRWSSSLRLQLSLKALLIVLTAAAIGVGVWTRWPIAEEATVKIDLWRERLGYTIQAKRETSYYRRGLYGERIRHGSSKLFGDSGELLVSRTYSEGVLHGPYREWYTNGDLRTEGNFFRGWKDGKWQFALEPRFQGDIDALRRTQNWQRGVPHGAWLWEDRKGQVALRATYANGRVLTVNGTGVIDWIDEICRGLPPGKLNDDWREFHRSQANAGLPDWMLDPLAGSVSFTLEYDHDLPPAVAVDELRRNRDVPFAVELAWELHKKGRAATRRFNCLFITTPERAKSGFDPTGVMQLKDPAIEHLLGLETELAADEKIDSRQTWGESWNYSSLHALEHLRNKVGLPLEKHKQAAGQLLSLQSNWHGERCGVRELLGLTLHRSKCCCELDNGVIMIRMQSPP